MAEAMDHFAEAERLLTPSRRWYGGHAEATVTAPSQSDIERAKAHATLALVAELRAARVEAGEA